MSRPAPEAALARPKNVSVFPTADKEFYPEPFWPVEQLAEAENWPEKIWDPACGYGTIPQVFNARGHKALGTDLADRGYGVGGQDFLSFSRKWVRPTQAIVCNPPFSLADKFIRQAKQFTTEKAAFLLPLKWLASQTRYDFFEQIWIPARIYVLSNRLSMPPGQFIDPETRLFNCDDPNPKKDGSLRWKEGDEPKGGAVDFCWIVFDHEHCDQDHTTVRWISKGGIL